MLDGFTRTRNPHQRRRASSPSMAARAAAAAACTAIRSPICPGTRSRRRWRSEFTVVCTDLRGYGDSSKPPGRREPHQLFLPRHGAGPGRGDGALGFGRFAAAGHDRGARVLHRMCLDHPGQVERAAFLDILPQHYLLNQHQPGIRRTFSYHWFFMVQPFDFPERLMGADPEFFIRRKLAKTRQGLSFFEPGALAEYIRCIKNPATIHAMCEDYRATFGVDLDMDTADFAAGRKVTARSCCCGAPPAGWANITSRSRYGRVMPAISGAAWRSPGAIISAKSARQRRRPSCSPSSPSGRADPEGERPSVESFLCKMSLTRMGGVCAKMGENNPEEGMRIYTVTKADSPLAVVRASSRNDAIDTAVAMISALDSGDGLDVRDPNDAEMVGWLERRSDYAVEERTAAA